MSRLAPPGTRWFRTGLPLLLLASLVAAVRPDPATPVTPDSQVLRSLELAPASDSFPRIDGNRLLNDLSILAHDSMEGRGTGTPGGARARAFLIEEFDSRGLSLVDGHRTLEFALAPDAGGTRGVNVVGLVEGTERPDRFIVVSAHYDHLGIRAGEIFNGADDNASGTAALLALADHFVKAPPRHSLLFVAFDAEESGLRGARAFVADPPIPLASIGLNVNLDMVSRSEAGELYAAGTFHYPFLRPMVEEVAAGSRIHLLMGHDAPNLPAGDDWTLLSDHGPFHQAGIPFLYFGVEDHPGYHDASDTFDRITPEFYIDAVETILAFLLLVDDAGMTP
jgi:Zn-dependent M28 family amino/carboxypeptidase